jgi:hypothetical protein
MRARLEEVPEPDEPEPDEPDEEPVSTAATLVPAVEAPVERDFEYRVDTYTIAEVLDGKTLTSKLEQASHDEWHLVEVIDCGDKKAFLLRKRKEKKPDRRPLGFFPPGR